MSSLPVPLAQSIGARPASHLIDIIKTTKKASPDFCLFLGAGASASSGVYLASQMIEQWRSQLYRRQTEFANSLEFLRHQTWFQHANEYSMLFELVYDHPSQRRDFIETCLRTATPSWGYIYLVNLLRHRVFDAIYTTNFDDLLQEACYAFSHNVRPLVCAHDSSIHGLRLTSERPKIIKLHGDFLFDNIKNTVSELAAIENNMAEKFRQFSSEFGMIVIGYGGCDASIMNLFESQLKRDDAFRHGLYWCIKRGAPQSPNVLRLARHPAVRFIEIDGFDEFFAELHESLGLPLQQEVAAPYKSLAERLNGLVVRREGSDVYTRHPIIDRDIQLIGRNIELMSHANGESESGRSGDAVGATATPIPFELLSDIEIGRRNYDKAVTYLLQEFDRTNQSRPLLRALEVACEYALPRHIDQIVPIICASKSILEGQPTAVMNVSLYLMKAARYRDALEVLNAVEAANHRRGDVAGFSPSYFLINKLQAKRHLAIALDEDEIALAEQLLVQKDLLIRLGSEIVLEKFHEAEETMFRALQSGALATTELWWPIFRLLKPHLSNLLLAQMLDQFETLRPASSRRVQNTAGRKQESADSPNK